MERLSVVPAVPAVPVVRVVRVVRVVAGHVVIGATGETVVVLPAYAYDAIALPTAVVACPAVVIASPAVVVASPVDLSADLPVHASQVGRAHIVVRTRQVGR